MSESSCSLLSCSTEARPELPVEAFEGPPARWCPGCGDHAVLSSIQRLLHDLRLAPERTVFVSGIGCSSRLPHHVRTYGFHGIHGRALPLASGIKLQRPDLAVFAVMGDGDCCSIGAGHWIHAIRYNIDFTAIVLDNNIYGLTKNQSSPTTPQGHPSSTQPEGTWLPALDPLSATLGVSNASFVAQTADWVPAHVYATLKAAHEHKGFAFVRILQRCPKWTPDVFRKPAMQLAATELLVHPDGIVEPEIEKLYKRHVTHDPRDLNEARRLATETPADAVRLGLFYKNPSLPRYDETRRVPVHTAEDKIRILEEELDRHAV